MNRVNSRSRRAHLHELAYLGADGRVIDVRAFYEDPVAQLRAPSASWTKDLKVVESRPTAVPGSEAAGGLGKVPARKAIIARTVMKNGKGSERSS